MGISNLASGLRTGVCTSTTRPTAPYNGQVIYETDSKQTLVWQGSAWVMLTDADTPPGLQLIKTQTIGSAVSSVEVTSAFSSEFDNYKITVQGGSTAADAALSLALGSSTTGYYSSLLYAGPSASSASGGGQSNQANWVYAGVGTSNGINMNVDLFGPFATKTTSIMSFYAQHSTTGNFGVFSGFHNSATSYTSFTIGGGGTTMTGGIIRVYGYRNAV